MRFAQRQTRASRLGASGLLEQDDLGIAAVEALEPAHHRRLGFECHHLGAKPAEGARAVAEVGADIEYQAVLGNEGL